MQYSSHDLLIFFLIYGFAGFILESSFRSITNKNLTIRGGFLTNYFCPLYGFCGIIIIQIFTVCDISFANRFTALFTATLSSIIAVTFLEYVTGFTFDRFLHLKMWDYSQNQFNLHSYVCLEFSLIWGIVAILLSSFIHPIIEVAVMAMPKAIKILSISLIFVILVINSSFNIRRYNHLNDIRL